MNEGASKLQKINKQAAEYTSKALCKLIERPVEVKIVRTAVEDIKELSPSIDAEDMVAGVYLPITGDVKGAALLIFPQDMTFTLCDYLMEKQPGTTRKLNKLDEAAIKEVGNQVCGSYFTVLSNELEIRVVEHVPDFSFAMFGSIIEQIITKFSVGIDKAMVIEVTIKIKQHDFTGYLLLLFELDALKAILGGGFSEYINGY